MGKLYENTGANGVKNDHDFRISIVNKSKGAIYELKQIIKSNQKIFDVIALKQGEQALVNYPNKKELLRASLYLDAFTGLIVNNLCALAGKGKNDTLSLYNNKKLYDEISIDRFYLENENMLNSLFKARNKVYAHIDSDVPDFAFLINIDFFEKYLDFAEEILKGGKKHE